MPAKINMFLSNGNHAMMLARTANTASLSVAPTPTPAPTALNAPILQRVHNVRPGCGSCGRH